MHTGKTLGLLDVFAIAAGAMISSGLFVLPGIAFSIAGPAMITSYLVAGLLVVPAIFSKAELATAMPKTGGTYFYIERSMGALPGTLAGLAHWLSISLKSAFALVGIGAFVSVFYPSIGVIEIKCIAVVCCLMFAGLNLFSVKGTGRAQSALVAGLLLILCLYVLSGIGKVDPVRLTPYNPHGTRAILATAGMVFVSYGGLTKIASVGEEIRNPARTIPLGMFSAFVVVNALYLLVIFVTVGVVPAESLSGSLMPISLGARITEGRIGLVLTSIAALMAFITTANAGILSASRSPMAMSRDGLLPASLQKTSRRFGTPHISIAVTAGFMIVVILALSVENLVKVASVMMIMLFVLVNVAVIIMRQSNIPNYRPTFRTPLYPWPQVIGIVAYCFLIIEMGAVPLILTGVFAVAAMLWYLIYVHRRIDRESALVYMVKTIASRHIRRTGLEEELKQIALERDGVVQDRFDDLIQNSTILDIDESIAATELFERAAETLAPRLQMNEADVYDLFLAREKESTTVVKPGLAIPHIVVKGEDRFDVLLVRCRKGIVFSELNPAVKTAFILIGSENERNFHLRALMAIAHIVEEPGFEDRWLSARNMEQLRDVVLLSARKRDDQ